MSDYKNNPTGNSPLTREMYFSMVDAYREKPANYAHCVRVTGVGKALAKRAWERGWLDYGYSWAPAIKVFLQQEEEYARSYRAKKRLERLEAEEEYRDLAREDAIRARAEEGKMVEGSRSLSMGLLGQGMKLTSIGKTLIEELETRSLGSGKCKSCGCQLGLSKMKVSELVMLVKRMATISSEAVAVGKESMRMERLHLGRPETILGIDDSSAELTEEDIIAEMKAIAKEIGADTLESSKIH